MAQILEAPVTTCVRSYHAIEIPKSAEPERLIFGIIDMMDTRSSSDLPEPAEGSDEQPDPVPLMDRSCNANILEKVLEYLTKHHEFDKAGTSQVCTNHNVVPQA